ncbi:MAG TPA: pantetheine-phosphate adenylyltransferase [Patescibacteria group bacterium]|nr:pantetheine-phosphate adenylyltransferase [Patescibacteria group bacterium]
MRTAIYPGTFDPITYGHVDVIERAAMLFDKVILVIAINSRKTPLFSIEERLEMSREALAHLKNVAVEIHEGLLVDFARTQKAVAIIRGVRAVTDFEYEFQIALMNRKLEPEICTLFLMPNEKYSYLNSTIVRELARYHQDISEFVPAVVARKIKEKF